jgi:hypothetical protein
MLQLSVPCVEHIGLGGLHVTRHSRWLTGVQYTVVTVDILTYFDLSGVQARFTQCLSYSKVNVNLSLCLTTYHTMKKCLIKHHATKTYMKVEV